MMFHQLFVLEIPADLCERGCLTANCQTTQSTACLMVHYIFIYDNIFLFLVNFHTRPLSRNLLNSTPVLFDTRHCFRRKQSPDPNICSFQYVGQQMPMGPKGNCNSGFSRGLGSSCYRFLHWQTLTFQIESLIQLFSAKVNIQKA